MPLDNVENEVVLDTGSESGDEGGNGDVKSRIQSLEQTAQATQGYARLLADPDIRAVMDAKQTGRKIKVIPLSAQGEPLEPQAPVASTTVEEKEPDWDNASQKEIHAYFMKQTMRGVESLVTKTINDKIQPLSDAIGQIASERQESRAKSVADQVKAMRAKYKDFDRYGEAMVELDKQVNGSLSVQELYETTKRRAGHPLTAPKETLSERPTHASARPPASQQPGANGKRGNNPPTPTVLERNANFRDAIRNAAQKVMDSPDEPVDENEEEG